jgi:hypothetical protein
MRYGSGAQEAGAGAFATPTNFPGTSTFPATSVQ